MPKVSVIVTTYNRQELLQETIQGVLNQTFSDFELIVVDNYSNYDFFAVIEAIGDKRIKAFQNQNDGIIAVNRNVGISYAEGEYLAFCDDDDIWLPNKLEIQVGYLHINKCDLVYTNIIMFFESGCQKVSNYKSVDFIKDLMIRNQITLSSVIVRKSNVVKFNEKMELVGIEDYFLWVQLIMNNYIFHFAEEPLVRYRVLDSTYSRQGRSDYELKVVKLKKEILLKYKLSFFNKLRLVFSIIVRSSRSVVFRILNR